MKMMQPFDFSVRVYGGRVRASSDDYYVVDRQTLVVTSEPRIRIRTWVQGTSLILNNPLASAGNGVGYITVLVFIHLPTPGVDIGIDGSEVFSRLDEFRALVILQGLR